MSTRERAQAWASTAQLRAEGTLPGAALRRFYDDGMQQRAASLAFYALFSLIPIFLIAAATFRLLGNPGVIADAQDAAKDAGASSSVVGVLKGMLETAINATPEDASGVGLVGLATLLYGSSKVFTDAGRALDQLRGVARVVRPLTKRAADLVWTVVLVVCVLAAALLMLLTGTFVEGLLDTLGLGSISQTLWNLARWPLVALLTLLVYALVTWAGPTVARRPFRVISAGAVVAAVLWIAASAGYTIYLANFASYNATYGAFAAVIILMLWVWFSCLAFLYGAEIDAVIEQRRSAP